MYFISFPSSSDLDQIEVSLVILLLQQNGWYQGKQNVHSKTLISPQVAGKGLKYIGCITVFVFKLGSSENWKGKSGEYQKWEMTIHRILTNVMGLMFTAS